MFIKLNGKPYDTKASSLDGLKKEIYEINFISPSCAEEFVWIADGFQTNENIALSEDSSVFFIEKGAIPPKDELEAMMAARHTPKVHEKLKKSRVAVAGLGGLGSNIAVMLARVGVGTIHLIDFDVVEPSNLNRQQYFISHLGMKKTEALKHLLSQINPYINVVTDDCRVTAENCGELFKDDEIVCEAFDRPEAKAVLAETLLSLFPEKILVAASGMAGFGDSNLIKTEKIGKNFYLCGDRVNSAMVGRGLMAPRVTICAAHQANLVLELLCGQKN